MGLDCEWQRLPQDTSFASQRRSNKLNSATSTTIIRLLASPLRQKIGQTDVHKVCKVVGISKQTPQFCVTYMTKAHSSQVGVPGYQHQERESNRRRNPSATDKHGRESSDPVDHCCSSEFDVLVLRLCRSRTASVLPVTFALSSRRCTKILAVWFYQHLW